uniref:Uncharacterized protein n=1 Tax=Colobus angolensis palliatus TaxID=336983 RepID=A0A2K5J727_COLAP
MSALYQITITVSRESVSTSQSRNIGLLTLGQLQNCVIGKWTIIDLLTEHLLGVRHGAICFPWGLPLSS